MSFSKAKYSRFNEVPLGCGPDVTYNVTKNHKIINAGVVLESKIPRFPNILAVPSRNTEGSDTGSVHSVQSARCFRTPQPPRRPISRTPLSSKCARTKNILTQDLKIDNAPHHEIVQAKLVEIRNKDETIMEYEHQIEELKNKIRVLQEQLVNASKEFDELQTKHQFKMIEEIQMDYDVQLSDLNKKIEEHENDALQLQEKILNLEDKLAAKELIAIKLQEENLDAKNILEEKKCLEDILKKTNLELEELKAKFYKERSELNAEIKTLTERVGKLSDNFENLMKQNEDDMLSYVEENQRSANIINSLEDCKSELSNQLKSKQRLIINLQSELSEKILELETQKHELSKQLSEQIEALQNEHLVELKEKNDTVEEYQKNLVKVKSELTREIDLMRELHDMKIKEMESIREVEKMNIVKEYTDKMNERENKVKAEFAHMQETAEEKIKLVEILSEDKCRQIEISCQNKLEMEKSRWESVFDKCQKIAETEVIQCELEKIDLQAIVHSTESKLEIAEKEKSMLKENIEAYLLEISDLKVKLSNFVKEYNSTKCKFEHELKELRSECEKVRSEKYKYELTLGTTRSTVAILSERLNHSCKYMDSLKEEVDYVTKEKLDLENDNISLKTENEKLNQVLDSLNISLNNVSNASRKLLALNECMEKDNELLLEEMSAVEEKTEQKINTVRKELLQKCDVLVAENYKNEELLSQAKAQLAETLEALSNTTNVVSDLTNKTIENDREIEELRNELDQLNIIVKIKDKEVTSYMKERELNKLELESNKEKLIEKTLCLESKDEDNLKLQEKIKEQEIQINSLNEQVASLDSLIGPFRKQLEEFDLEKKALELKKNVAVDESRKTALKYAELLGHQNNKQKIKHVIKIKNENLELKQEITNLELIVEKQKRTIENLKKTSLIKSPNVARKTLIASTPRGKENRSPANSPIRSSPALRDRNI